MPLASVGYEQSPGAISVEREHTPGEQLASPMPAMPPSLPAIPTIPQPVGTPAPADPVATSANPVVAADDDLIEKEWVDQAKKIINDTKDDPRRRELEVTKLQIDYLKKRYGRDVGNVA